MSTQPVSLRVQLDARSYDITIGGGVLAQAGALLAPLLPAPRVIVVSDKHVAPLYADTLKLTLEAAGIHCELIAVSAGEGAKSFASLEALLGTILALAPDRKTTLLALGGGVVGDLAGFAASVLLRGVPFVQVPTSLLAQVDSSVGGKTAINTRAGKNLVGSFYQPLAVLADLDTLATLPPREMRAGYAEIIKYGLIMDRAFYDWCLEHGAQVVAGEREALQYAVHMACHMKAEIVGADEREAGMRALLNFGHTFAHALEAELNYDSRLLHGEAVAIGMVMACRLSAKLGLLEEGVEQQLAAHLKQLGLPTSPRDVAHDWNAAHIAAHFAGDKKAEHGALTFVVLEDTGKATVVKRVDPALAHEVVAAYL